MSSRRFLGIALTEGVLPRHLSAYLLVALISSGFAGILAFLEPGLWHAMEIPRDEWGLYTGRLRAVQEIFYIGLMGVFGAASDKLGRRSIYTFGLVFIFVGAVFQQRLNDNGFKAASFRGWKATPTRS